MITYSFLDSQKRDGVTPKNVKMIGNCFLSLVDNLFWYLPFASSKQAYGRREKAVPAVTEENWAAMYAAITAEHNEDPEHNEQPRGAPQAGQQTVALPSPPGRRPTRPATAAIPSTSASAASPRSLIVQEF